MTSGGCSRTVHAPDTPGDYYLFAAGRPEEQAARKGDGPEAVTMAEAARILIVEDDPHIGVILALKLREAGLDVRVAADGLEALEIFETWHPALVTLDLAIPTISGFRLIALFKRWRPDVPVIVATALDFEDAVEVARSGADDFLTKPFDLALLLRKIGFHLRPAADTSGRPRALLVHHAG